MKIIKLIKLILLKLIIRLDEALIDTNLQAKAGRDEHNQDYSTNKRANRATSTYAADEYKVVIGKAKAKLADKRANRAAKGKVRRGRGENKFGDKDKATIENENKDKREDNNNGRGKYNFRLWEINKSYKEVEGEIQPDHQPYPYSLYHSYYHSYFYHHYYLFYYFQ